MTESMACKNRHLSLDELRTTVEKGVAGLNLDGKKVLTLIPDHTRSGPFGEMYRILCETLGQRAAELHFLIALGTHPPLEEERINEHLGLTPEERSGKYSEFKIFNHLWSDPNALATIGTIPASEIDEISSGLFSEDVPVEINKMIFDYDALLIMGPTFPHEVVGFSGGRKYIFPGIAGPQIINFFHWLGAVITNIEINGTKHTPVREVVDRASEMIDIPVHCCSLVVTDGQANGIFIGDPVDAWSEAADLSSGLHIKYLDRQYPRVLAIAPEMYDDIWTAGKCMYKLEPIVADGGELVIYAPHIDEISYTHGKVLDEIGYHTRDYFLKQMDKFKDYPRGVTAHSTHVRGIGTFEDGVEKPRVTVTLATRIPEERCRKVHLGYRDPDTITVSDWEGREDEGILVVHHAGEILHKLKSNG